MWHGEGRGRRFMHYDVTTQSRVAKQIPVEWRLVYLARVYFALVYLFLHMALAVCVRPVRNPSVKSVA